MSNTRHPAGAIPFPAHHHASGVLVHITSLPSPYGIGDVGPAAFTMIDRLQASGQSWWQALPLGPTGYGNSPYQCLSSFAGNGLIISPDGLIEEGVLRVADCDDGRSFPNYFCWMTITGRDLLLAFRPTISARKGNCGATRSMIGRHFNGPVTVGV